MGYYNTLPNLAIAFLILNVGVSSSTSLMKTKSNARPVHETINEQSRIDKQLKTVKGPVNLPFGNPLAGNSQQNARLHAQNQQAMFNAERIRQHRAQLQRLTKAPTQMDSYMKAYHDSQETHQFVLEQQQAKLREANSGNGNPTGNGPVQKKRQLPNPRPERVTSENVVRSNPETTKFTKADAVIKTDKNRNHRSYGSDYQQYLSHKKYQTVYVSPGPTYDQGVTIKPNGNVGISHLQGPQETETTKLYTEAVPSKTQYVYPKLHSQMQSYQSAQEIDALNSLLKKTPQMQLSQLNALLHSSDETSQHDTKQSEIDTPIDLYFYLKDTPAKQQQEYESTKYAQIPQDYVSSYAIDQPAKDHTPIMEDVDDIADPNQHKKPYGLQPQQVSQQPLETTTTKSNNYYKVEVASQTISSGYKPSYYKQYKTPTRYYSATHEEAQDNPTYSPLHYPLPTAYIQRDPKEHEDINDLYLHHNAQHTGIHHLSGDGTGVSAYGDDENLQYAANYEFGYRVRDHHSGNDFGHQERKKGDKTDGHYHVLLPDGRMQNVKYSAGPEGFHADISYDHLEHKH